MQRPSRLRPITSTASCLLQLRLRRTSRTGSRLLRHCYCVGLVDGDGEAFSSGLGRVRVLSWSPNWCTCVCRASVCFRTSAFSSSRLGSGRNNIPSPPSINPNRKATSDFMSPLFAVDHPFGPFPVLFLYLGPDSGPAN